MLLISKETAHCN